MAGARRSTGAPPRHPGYATSQRIRKRIEEAFGSIKTVAGLKKTRFRGLARVNLAFSFAVAAYNLVRLPSCSARSLTVTAPMDCRLVGHWRIVEADLWDRDYLDLVAPAAMTIGADGHGEIAYGAMQASLELKAAARRSSSRGPALTRWDDVSGSGAAELQDDGSLQIEFAYHLGDDAILKAERMTSSTAC